MFGIFAVSLIVYIVIALAFPRAIFWRVEPYTTIRKLLGGFLWFGTIITGLMALFS